MNLDEIMEEQMGVSMRSKEVDEVYESKDFQDRALKNSVIANLNEIIWFNGAVENTFCVDYTKSYNDVCCFSTLLVHSLMKDTKTVQPVCSRSLIPAKRILYHFRLPKSNNLTK